MNKEIDIIIPLYNIKNNILTRCLSSIACQENVNELQVIIVDDCSDNQDYQQVISIFNNILDIKLLRLEVNSGPGVARQFGIENSNNKFIVFVDADDSLKGSMALKILKQNMKNFDVCVGDFEEIHDEIKDKLKFISHKNNMIWLFSKMYRRDFIEKNNIKFHPTSRANEDVGFNTMVNLLTNKINFISNQLYYWHSNPDSITRRDNAYYAIGPEPDNSIYGLVENKIYALNFVKNSENLVGYKFFQDVVKVMTYLYEQYLQTINSHPEFIEEKYRLCVKFYQEIFQEYENNFLTKIRIKEYKTAKNLAIKYGHTKEAPFSFEEFLYDLKNEEDGV